MPLSSNIANQNAFAEYFPSWNPISGDNNAIQCAKIKEIITDVRSAIGEDITEEHILATLEYLNSYSNDNSQDSHRNEPIMIKQEVINILGLHETIHFLMNFYNSTYRADPIFNFNKTKFTAIKILYEVQNLVTLESSNEIANIEFKVLEIGNLYVGYKLFKFIEDKPLSEQGTFINTFEAFSSKNAYKANNARHEETRNAENHALAYFNNKLHIYNHLYNNKLNYTKVATDIFWNGIKEEHRKSYKSYSDEILEYQKEHNYYPSKDQMKAYITAKYIKKRFPAIKTLSEKIGEKHRELLIVPQ